MDQGQLFLTANPEAAELLKRQSADSEPLAWEEFLQSHLTDLDSQEIELLSKVASMGRARSPNDFVYVLNSIRQIFGRDLLDSVPKRDGGSSTRVESSRSENWFPSSIIEKAASITAESDGIISGASNGSESDKRQS